MILVDVVQRRLEHDVGAPALPEPDQQLEDVLAMDGKRPHLEVVDVEVAVGDAELGCRLAHLASERVRRKAVR